MSRILCIGDSNTWGYDPRVRFDGRYGGDVRWTERLDGWETVNDGINGRTIPEPEEYADTQRLRPETFDAVAVMLGTNDLLLGCSAEKAAGKMEPFLRFLLGIAGNARVLLIAPPLLRHGDWVSDRPKVIAESEKLSGAYRALSERLGAAFADAGRWGVGIAFDGVHFSPEGHAAFAAGLSAVLKEL